MLICLQIRLLMVMQIYTKEDSGESQRFLGWVFLTIAWLDSTRLDDSLLHP